MIDSADSAVTGRELLAAARSAQDGQDAEHTRLLIIAGRWADEHPAGDGVEAEHGGGWLRAGAPLAGEGTPAVAEDAVAELAACLSLSTSAGKFLIGEALELRHRLPRVWALLMAGRVRPGRARQVAASTIVLTPAAAAFVDTMVAAVMGRVGPRQLERIVVEATLRHDPDGPAHIRVRGEHDPRGVWVGDRCDGRGLSQLSGVLDTPDALALDAWLEAEAVDLADRPGLEDLTTQARRALALGDLVRHQPALALEPEDGLPTDSQPADRQSGRRRRPERGFTMVVHLSEQALTAGGVGRLENTAAPISVERIREWVGDPTARIKIQPVIDLHDRIHTDAYEISDRLRRQIQLIELTCVFPYCQIPALRCDLDHIEPYESGGPTSTDNLAPLCRSHHRLKTHSGWRYCRLPESDTDPPGPALLWTSPCGVRYLRDHTGTQLVADDTS